jgi:methionine-rich copper-binding protein CopC
MKKWHIALAGAVVTLVGIGGLALPSTASAHARLKSSTPGVSEVVQTSPSQVVIIFTEDVQKVSGTYGISVTKDRGPDVTAGPAVLDDTDRSKMSVPLQPDLAPGRYVVEYHNVSDDDGDPFNGAFAFYIQTQPTAVDKANDAQLAQIGPAEGTPGADATASSGTPSAAPTTSAATVPATGGATAVATTDASSTSDNGGSNTGRNIAIAAAIVVALAVAAGAGWFAFLRPRR